MSPKEVAQGALDAWNNRDFDRMRDLMHPEYTFTGPDGREQRGPDAGMAMARMWAAAVPDGRIDSLNITEAGNTAVAEFVGRGTHNGDLMGIAPTGKRVTIPICEVLELRDGKIYRHRQYLDAANVLAQIGAMPAPTAASA